MQPSNPNFWTRVDGRLQYRNLQWEESQVRHSVFSSWQNRVIDEPVVIYYEIYDCHSSDFIDDNIYQRDQCYIKPGDIVLDLGGNIGIFSRFAADAGAKKIYTFEPVQENFQLLSLNKPANCEAHRLAVSNVDNQALQIAYKVDSPGGSSFVLHEDGQLQTCMSITVDTLIDNGIIEQPDFIKMDIEGAETYAFEGISDDKLRKVRCLAMEIHIGAIGKKAEIAIYSRMHSLGFTSFTLFNPDECNIVWFTNSNLI